jgi:glycosyltransferase involved in cell wall biosynthesis
MKVLHVITTLAERYGGPTTVLRSLAHEQALRGHQVTICTTSMDYPTGILDVPADQAVDERGVTVWYHKLNSRPLCFSFSLARWLFEHVSDYDVVHVHGLYRFPPTFAAKLARAKGIPYLIKPHGSLDPYLYQQSPYSLFLKRLYERLFDLPNLHRAGAIQYTTDEEAKRASFLRLSAPGVVVRSGIDWRNFAQLPRPGGFRERMGIGSDQPLVLFLGRLNFKKGLDLLIPAFAQVLAMVPDSILAIVGPDNEGLGAKVRRWCMDNAVTEQVRFIDHIPPDETRQAYVDADAFALTSYTENTGMTVVEAMACGCPVVISDQVNIWPLVDEAGAGIVVSLEVPRISSALVRVLTDSEASVQMGASGRTLAQEQFSWEHIVGEFDRLYETLVRGERPVMGESLRLQ